MTVAAILPVDTTCSVPRKLRKSRGAFQGNSLNRPPAHVFRTLRLTGSVTTSSGLLFEGSQIDQDDVRVFVQFLEDDCAPVRADVKGLHGGAAAQPAELPALQGFRVQ